MANGFVRPPELESSVVAKLILGVFPFKEVKESSVKQLPSYEDRNYYLTSVTNCGSTDENTEGEFVLKISNSLMDIELKKGHNDLPICINKALNAHNHRRNGNGVEVLSKRQLLAGDPGASEGGGPKFCLQVLTYIPGKTMESVPFTPRLAYEAGRYIGSMDAALQVQ